MRVKKLKRVVDRNTANSKSEDDDHDHVHVLHWTQGHPRGTKFQCFARTGDGSVAVGSFDGKIRLYSKSSMKQAKTVFPGLGYPITHIDVTHDGKWILATTDTYLILMSTLFTDLSKDGKIRKTGFTGRMGNKFPPPTLLKLTPADLHTVGVDNRFQDGQFSWVTESRKEERHLVTTVGEFRVLWNFQQVKNSGHECYRTQQGLKSCYCYKLVPKDELIIETRFMHEHDKLDKSPDVLLDVVATPPIKVTSINMLCKKEDDDTPS